MASYSLGELAAAAQAAGFQGAALVNAIAVSLAENGRMDTTATNRAGNSPPSTDRGPFQINSFWHPEVSDACAFDLKCSAQAAFRISSGGTNFNPWSTWTNGAAKGKLQQAQGALSGLSGASAQSAAAAAGPVALGNPLDAVGKAINRTVGMFIAGGQLVAGGVLVLVGIVLLVFLLTERTVLPQVRQVARAGRAFGG